MRKIRWEESERNKNERLKEDGMTKIGDIKKTGKNKNK